MNDSYPIPLRLFGALVIACIALCVALLVSLTSSDNERVVEDSIPAMKKPHFFYSLGLVVTDSEEEPKQRRRDSWQAEYDMEHLVTRADTSGSHAIGGPDVNADSILTPSDQVVVQFRKQKRAGITDEWKQAPKDIERKYRDMYRKMGIRNP